MRVMPKRLIPLFLLDGSRLVKGTRFRDRWTWEIRSPRP
jgi:hypothetical protein